MEDHVETGQTTSLAEYSEIDAGIAALKEKYSGRVYDVTTTAGMKDAKVARAAIRGQRTLLEKTRKAIKAPAWARCKLIDSEARRIEAAILEIENPIDTLIKEREAVKAAEKEAREQAERDRVAAILGKITEMKFTLSEYHPVAHLEEWLEKLNAIDMDGFAEFTQEAADARMVSARECGEAILKATEREEEERKAEEEREVKEEKAAQEKAERERVTREQQAAIEKENERLNAEREKLAADKAAADKLEAERQKKAEAEAIKQAEQNELLEDRCESHLEALKKIIGYCDTETWSHATKVRRIKSVAQGMIRGNKSDKRK